MDSPDEGVASPRGERRWPPALAVLVLIGLPFLLPAHLCPRLLWAVAPIEVGLMIAIVVADPGRIDKDTPLVRGLEVTLSVVLVLLAGFLTAALIVELLDGAPDLREASTLLATGGLVWAGANVAFALLYWQLDGGGSARRLQRPRAHPDFMFPEHANPELARPGWRPTFADYLYLGFTNATAFSPTDVMPLAAWAKLTMAFQAVLSLLILSLVIANAVNILGS